MKRNHHRSKKQMSSEAISKQVKSEEINNIQQLKKYVAYKKLIYVYARLDFGIKQ